MIKTAIMGFGVVGSGVAEVLSRNSDKIAESSKNEIQIKYILDIRDFPDSPYADLFIKDFSVIENDPEVSVVVETMGGKGKAYEFTRRCLLAGKHVVTSNKELVAAHGVELITLARERNLNYLFEASVGGGIPIVRPILQCLAANELTEIFGILNGTTNYILTRMIREGVSFDAALKEAQQKGYAEADPTADIEGADTCRKICILSALAFGRHIGTELIPTEGIGSIRAADIRYADGMERVVKLIGRAVKLENGRIFCEVSPYMLPRQHPLSGVEDVFNGIIVKGNAIDEVMFYGRGAGKLPTASAVVADIIDAAKHLQTRKYLDWEEITDEKIAQPGEVMQRCYIRCACADETVLTVFPEAEILPGGSGDETAAVLPGMPLDKLEAELSQLSARAEILSKIKLLS